MKELRLFVAVNFSEESKDQIGALIDELRLLPADAKWVTRKNLHLTLQFLGNTRSERVPSLVAALEAAGRGIGAFDLRFAEFGVFPNANRPRVLWLGLTGDVAVLSKLQGQVQDNLAQIGIEAEKRRFLPHLTLARLRTTEGLQPVLARAKTLMPKDKTIATELIDSFELVSSVLTPKGPIYTEMAKIKLST